MGRRDRERVARIQTGTELPISIQRTTDAGPVEHMRLCRKCNHIVPESRARQHIRDCWGMPIKDTDPIPEKPPPGKTFPIKVGGNA